MPRRLAPLFVLAASLLLAARGAAQDSPWKTVKVPDIWKSAPGNGVIWYRCWVQVPETWRGRAAEVFVEAADDAREVFVNGKRVGGEGEFPPQYRSGLGEPDRFAVAAELLSPGKPNVIAIRIYQEPERRAGFNVAAPVLFGGDQALRLDGAWQHRAGDDPAWAVASDVARPPAESLFAKVEPAADVARTLRKLSGEAGPQTPAEALRRFTTPDDLEVELVLSEPEVGQPLQISWDERGRLWVVQFRQYPNPAGLKMVSRDKFLRAVYDRVPPAPPHHDRGEDRITIHEDTDGDGRLDRHKTFVDGLNLASSCAIANDGVWVLNPPYLLFYPDRDRDDAPDGDPEVHLEGFGLEDSHSIANSLRWGPDGWLYGGQGSTVSGVIKRPGTKDPPVHSMGQLIWRYHPTTRKYEIFAEGGGNTFGVEIDAKGRVYSGHNGGDTRGFHYVQGGYFQKGFGKHGSLSNPYSFGYFPQMAHHSVPRFTHTFVIYESTALPASYHGKLFGVEPLQGRVVFSEVSPDRSSFKTRDLGHVLTTTDTWFRPVDIKVGPDGAVYVADFYEQRIDHASHYQGRVDKQSGRIYRLKAKGAPTVAMQGVGEPTSIEQWLERLRSTDRTQRQIALRVLGQRHDAALVPGLLAAVRQGSGQVALDALWALHQTASLDDQQAIRFLDHEDPYVRQWTVRLTCDDGQVSPSLRDRLVELAYREPNVEVRSQLASSARRLPAVDSLPIVRNLLGRGEDADDIHIPLLLWWAIEAKADSDRDAVVKLFEEQSTWSLPLVPKHIVSRLMRRYATPGTRKDLLTCAKLLEVAADDESRRALMKGFEEAYQGRSPIGLPTELVNAIAKSGGASLPLRLRQGEAAAVEQALDIVGNDKADINQRRQLVEVFGQVPQKSAIDVLIKVASTGRDVALRSAALIALQSYDEPRVGAALVNMHNELPGDVRPIAHGVLASRKTWTNLLLDAVGSGKVARESIPTPSVKKLLLRPDEQIAGRVRELFGEVQGATTDDMRAQIDRLSTVILAGSGNPYNGKQLYRERCGKCHQLFEDGGRIGPDLTSYKRDDLRRMLLNVVNPSAEIREGFENFVVITNDGRALNGFVADQDAQVVTLRGADGQTLVIPRDDIDEMRAVAVSLMPEGQLKDMSDQQVRDLFAYLRATQPLP